MIVGPIVHRTLLTGILLCGMAVLCHAQKKTVSDMFRVMPDSLLPVLSENNRLDMIDFMASGMKAAVTNRIGGESEMTALTDSSLTLHLSEALTVDMALVNTTEAYDSCHQLVRMVYTYQLSSGKGQESVTRYFTLRWRPLQQVPQGLPNMDSSTILKQDEEIMNKILK